MEPRRTTRSTPMHRDSGQNVTAVEGAFQLAKFGQCSAVQDIRCCLKLEGYSDAQVTGVTPVRQLRASIKASRFATATSAVEPDKRRMHWLSHKVHANLAWLMCPMIGFRLFTVAKLKVGRKDRSRNAGGASDHVRKHRAFRRVMKGDGQFSSTTSRCRAEPFSRRIPERAFLLGSPPN